MKLFKFFVGFGLVLIAVVVILTAISFARPSPFSTKGKWQAVFLANNQVYFGHLVKVDGDYVGLKDIYYLKATQALQGTSGEPDLSIIKLGSELHGPEDFMYIPKSTILFWENLRNDSQVVQAIKNFTAEKNDGK